MAVHPGVRPDWLALVREDPVDPDQPIVDAHHHLWDKPGDRYLARDMQEDTGAGHNVVATVFVEADTAYRTQGPEEMRPVGETEMAVAEHDLALARGGARVAAGIVARADLPMGEGVGAVLDAHAEAGRGRFRGIRYSTPWHGDPAARGSARLVPAGLLYDPGMRAGLRELARRGLVFDAWMYHTQLGDLVDLAQAMPELRIVLNHCGGPLGIGPYAGRRDEVLADWRHEIGRLAAFPNIDVKIGGLGMRLAGFGLAGRERPPDSAKLAALFEPYVLGSIDAFGPGRCMFESNFPVDKGAMSYTVLWNTFQRLAERYGPDERHLLFFGTANRAYSLGLGAG
ncbi:MAG: amidohydrolase family protein [Pseudooceanicola nanhaiensis]